MNDKERIEWAPTTDQAQLWFQQLADEGKTEPLHAYLEERGYPYPGGCIANSLEMWKKEGRTFEDVDALDRALRREWSAQAGKGKSSWTRGD